MSKRTTIYDGPFPLRWSELNHLVVDGDERTTYVYATFDGDTCLYVGTSTMFGSRMEKHRTRDIWWSQADRLLLIAVKGSANRLLLWRAGARLEWQLMEELHPIHNQVGPKSLPSKRQNGVE